MYNTEQQHIESIYLDNASTSFPKPKSVPDAVYSYIIGVGVNINRGIYSTAHSAADMVFECREMLKTFFNADDCRNVVFTQNITQSLNIILKGLLKPGDHIICSAMEHNAVMRPLRQLEKIGIQFSRIPCTTDGRLLTDEVEGLLRPNTKAVVMLHASNVCGTVMPAEEIGAFCQRHRLKFILDTAQTAGVIPVDMQKMNIDALCFTGHKSLLGPQGIGGFIIKNSMVGDIDPILSGGTGSISHTEDIPDFMPDRFEPGTMNLPGIAGLKAGLEFITEQGISNIRTHEAALTAQFIDGVRKIPHLRVVGIEDTEGRTGTVSITTDVTDLAQLAFILDSHYGIQTRVGLHCAPNAHKTLGTYPSGTIRFSFGIFNKEHQIENALTALKEVLRQWK
ncbi:MAG: aminotransferase class V-fold PLP-dependent enzyme [Synergistes sp.]|nr:aminotransferase class V-fold PLP-dependent enzyme [Synergistes sp.]